MSSIEKNNKVSSETGTEYPILFLSDVHLGAFTNDCNRELESDLIQLIQFCESHQIKMVILGDLFDYWMEYSGKPPPLGQAVLHRFSEFHKNTGSQTLYVTGNHDNWTGSYLDQIGFDVEHEYRIIRCDDRSVMVLHGDGLRDPSMEFPRPVMHRIIRNPYFVNVYKTLIPQRMGWRLMQWSAGFNRKMDNKTKSRYHRELIDTWARNKVLNDDSIQAIVYGHHHHTVLANEKGNICMNCGYFGKNRTAGLYTNKKFKIVIWDTGKKELSDHQLVKTI